jgi:translation initiation factor IF-3
MRLVEELGDDGQMEVEPKMEGMNMFTIIAPRKTGAAKKPQQPAQPAQ